jgi:tRNA (cmo5U34)-methyltransferase
MNSSTAQRDSLFAQPLGKIDEFRFDENVAAVFPDMLQRSIPGYQSIIAQSGLLAARFAKANTNLYDLGCSLGATTIAMRSAMLSASEKDNIDFSGCVLHGIDNSAAMLDRASDVINTAANANIALSDFGGSNINSVTSIDLPVALHCEDMQTTTIENASIVALNFTLQFIPPDERDDMMRRIAKGLRQGCALILSEKVTFNDPLLSQLHIDMYHNFKRANGYSDLEISQKRSALENVLIPDTLETHAKRLKDAGFSSSSVWFQCFNFASIIAIK